MFQFCTKGRVLLQIEPLPSTNDLPRRKLRLRKHFALKLELRTIWGMPIKNIYALTTPYRELIRLVFSDAASSNQRAHSIAPEGKREGERYIPFSDAPSGGPRERADHRGWQLGDSLASPRRYAADRPRCNRAPAHGSAETRIARLLRFRILPASPGAVSRQYFFSARELCHYAAGDPGSGSPDFPGSKSSAAAPAAGPSPQRAGCGKRPGGLRQIIHSGGGAESNQRGKRSAHCDDRGPHRIPISSQKSDGAPARTLSRRAQFSGCAPLFAAPSPM